MWLNTFAELYSPCHAFPDLYWINYSVCCCCFCCFETVRLSVRKKTQSFQFYLFSFAEFFSCCPLVLKQPEWRHKSLNFCFFCPPLLPIISLPAQASPDSRPSHQSMRSTLSEIDLYRQLRSAACSSKRSRISWGGTDVAPAVKLPLLTKMLD